MAEDVVILIPARMAATRLPGKPLADIGGKPMIVHVLDRARAADVGPADASPAVPRSTQPIGTPDEIIDKIKTLQWAISLETLVSPRAPPRRP